MNGLQWKTHENPIKIHDLGGPPLFLETPIYTFVSRPSRPDSPITKNKTRRRTCCDFSRSTNKNTATFATFGCAERKNEGFRRAMVLKNFTHRPWEVASIKNHNWMVVSKIFYFHPYLGKIPIFTTSSTAQGGGGSFKNRKL